MTFVSYAQNFEDVLLWRALRDVEAGFYIDAGASHPDTDSVTRAFHDRGWSGINIEPEPEACLRLAAARPRDVTLQLALGAAAGEAVLHVVDGTGLSTLEPAVAASHAGMDTRPVTVRVDTLAAVCAAHVRRDIHFLKVDVEGSERAVLAGADFSRWRPWIVLVEATAPMTATETHAAWEGLLLDAAYGFVWFDGLNRYYVAAEHHERLAPAFRLPPNVFDNFVRAADSEWARRIHTAETDADAQRRRADRAEAELADRTLLAAHAGAAAAGLAAAFARLDARLSLASARIVDGALRTRGEAAQADDRLAQVNDRLAEARDRLTAVHASTSWRLTAPMRRITTGLRRQAAPPVPPDPPVVTAPSRVPALSEATPAHAGSPERRSTRVVHQFHSGSAVGDAITNSMLMIRGLLRGLGFASDIYVEHRDPLLADELLLVQELPEHDGYVLLVHHSMGYAAFDRIVELRAAKILVYHNITPVHLLPDSPTYEHYAHVGRLQLAHWRGLVVASMADSEYNALELRTLGFGTPRACMLLFSLDALRDRVAARGQGHRSAAFTVLFVGRVAASKGQDALVEAFAAFRASFGAPCRLVLVGRHGEADDPFMRRLRTAIAGHRLDDHVTFTGLVSDADLDAWYDAADLYVSASRHEGFGVPLVEAMAHGVPVLACTGGAVEYTLGEAPGLLADRDPAVVADAMRAVARDPGSHVRRQSAALDRFALARQIDILLLALATARAPRPEPPGVRAALAAGMRYTVTGHVNASYSLAVVNRTLALTLAALRPGRVRLAPVEGQPTDRLDDVPPAQRARIAGLTGRPPHDSGPQVTISQHYPVYVPDQPGEASFAMFFWEESLIPAETVALLNRSFRGVLAPTRFVAKVLIDSGVRVPVRLVSYVPDLARFAALARHPHQPQRTFTFLHVSSCFPRKGVDVLLAAYARAFRAGDPVRLIIKGFPNPHNEVAEQIAAARSADPGMAAVEFINRDLDDAALLALYAEAGAMVLPTRGEGFNIPAAEALAAGLPLIVTGHGGHMDFCDAGNARLVGWRHAPSGSHLATPHSVWAEPDRDDLAAALREAVADPAAAAARAAAGLATARRLAAGDPAAQLDAAALDAILAPPARPARIAWISTWNVRCGIAEYSRHILDNLPTGEDLPAPLVLSDERTLPEPFLDRGQTARPAWNLHQRSSFDELAQAIGRADPDVVVLQHQPGLFNWDRLTQLLALPALRGRAVSVTLHNTRHLLDVDGCERAATVAALADVARVVVHTLADLDRLHGLGLGGNTVLMPHGAPPASPPGRVRALAAGDAPVVGCYGFFLPGKGIAELIAALPLLRARWPHARLRLVNAQYDSPASAAEVAACRAAAKTLGDAVEWHTSFLPHEASLDLLAGCDLVVLPYQASQEASSAALRSVLTVGVPVMVSPIPLFDEVGDGVARFDGVDPVAIAAGIDRMLADRDRRQALQDAAQAWLAAHSWPAIAARFHLMLQGLAQPRITDAPTPAAG